jgi:hypothetical protein
MITQEDLLGESKAESISLEQLAQGEKVPSVAMEELDALGKPVYTPYEVLHSQFPYEIAKGLCLVPLRLIESNILTGDTLTRTVVVAVAHPEDPNLQKYLDNIDTYCQGESKDPKEEFRRACDMLTYRVKVQVAPEEKIREAINRFYSDEAGNERVGEQVLPILKMMDELDKITGGMTDDELDKTVGGMPENHEP